MPEGRFQPNRPDETGYTGVGLTFGRVPLVLEPAGLAGADMAIVGAPFDEGVSYRPGHAVRPAGDPHRRGRRRSRSTRPNMELGIDPYEELDIVDYGDVEVRAVEPRARRTRRCRRGVGRRSCRAGAVAVVLGGDHSLSTPVLAALAAQYGSDGFSVIHFDTHADTGLELEERRTACRSTRAVIDGHLDGHNIVQIGLRGAWPFPEEFDWMREQGFRWHTLGEIIERGIGPVVRDAIEYAPRAGAADLPDRRHRRARPGVRARARAPPSRAG